MPRSWIRPVLQILSRSIKYIRGRISGLGKFRTILSASILGIIAFITYILANEVFNWRTIESVAPITSGLGALGTLILAFVTLKTLEQNESLIQQQHAQQRPILRQLERPSTKPDNPEQIVFQFENVGEGKALNMRIVPKLYVRDVRPPKTISQYVDGRSNGTYIPTVESYEKGLVTIEKNPLNYSHKGAVLEAGSTGKFATRLDYRNLNVSIYDSDYDPSEEPKLLVFSHLLDYLEDSEIVGMGFQFKLIYEDIFGEEYEEELRGPVFSVGDDESLEEALHNPSWVLAKEPALIGWQ